MATKIIESIPASRTYHGRPARKVSMFAWLPISAGRETKWLCTVIIKQTYYQAAGRFPGGWMNEYFV